MNICISVYVDEIVYAQSLFQGFCEDFQKEKMGGE